MNKLYENILFINILYINILAINILYINILYINILALFNNNKYPWPYSTIINIPGPIQK